MDKTPPDPRALAVPSGRTARMARLGGLTTGVLGSVAMGGARSLARGQRPRLGDLLLTPANAQRLTKQLAEMRGAAMKMGQLLSMETGDLLPPELAQILARLRDDAHIMPPRQLKAQFVAAWGDGFQRRFKRFDVRPLAAASIGQVHRAQTPDGRDLAIKVQYPGVADSIDSDIANVASLLRLSGLLPRDLDIRPLLDEARRQLHEEADYEAEARHLSAFGDHLDGDAGFAVPRVHEDFSTRVTLAMDFMPGVPIETLAEASQASRDSVMTRLFALFLRELFDLRLMQTDPNFANYRFDPDTGRVVLLDFGATRAFSAPIIAAFRRLMAAGAKRHWSGVRAAAVEIGYFPDDVAPHHEAALMEMFQMAFGPLLGPQPFDFGTSDIAARMRDAGMEFGAARDFWHIPPMDALFLQRKAAGLYLLAARLGARVDLRSLVDGYLADDDRSAARLD